MRDSKENPSSRTTRVSEICCGPSSLTELPHGRATTVLQETAPSAASTQLSPASPCRPQPTKPTPHGAAVASAPLPLDQCGRLHDTQIPTRLPDIIMAWLLCPGDLVPLPRPDKGSRKGTLPPCLYTVPGCNPEGARGGTDGDAHPDLARSRPSRECHVRRVHPPRYAGGLESRSMSRDPDERYVTNRPETRNHARGAPGEREPKTEGSTTEPNRKSSLREALGTSAKQMVRGSGRVDHTGSGQRAHFDLPPTGPRTMSTGAGPGS